MTRHEYLTAWTRGIALLSLICFTTFAFSIFSISLGDVAELSMKIKLIAWRLGFGVIGLKLAVFAFWIYNKQEKESYRY